MTRAIAEAADDDTLLSLLFVPGFSTRESSDLLAGRGIGLEIARSVVQRMGGGIRLSSRAGEGFSARIDVPIESGLVTVLWVIGGDAGVRVPAVNVRRVRLARRWRGRSRASRTCCLPRRGADRSAARTSSTSSCRATTEPRPRSLWGSTRVGRTEELLVRPLGPLVAGLGPYAGAIVRGDGSLRLAIDAWAIAPRARAFSATRARSAALTPPSSSRASLHAPSRSAAMQRCRRFGSMSP